MFVVARFILDWGFPLPLLRHLPLIGGLRIYRCAKSYTTNGILVRTIAPKGACYNRIAF